MTHLFLLTRPLSSLFPARGVDMTRTHRMPIEEEHVDAPETGAFTTASGGPVPARRNR